MHTPTLFFSLLLAIPSSGLAAPPVVGGKAPDFTVHSLAGNKVQLSELTEKSTVVLVFLRGYPGYQCPVCNRQVQDFIRNENGFTEAGVQVVLVYPGSAERAQEFTDGKKFPSNFHLITDPDYAVTNLYDVRWNAPRETAYPSTFLIGQKGIVSFAKVSNTHGGRANAAEVLAALKKMHH